MVWEERWHPLRREWVIISTHRNERPWHGERIADRAGAIPHYSPDCYLCPGNMRSSGQANPEYKGAFVFDNDHPCVSPAAPTDLPAAPGIYRHQRASGVSRVLCFDPRHNVTLAQLSEAQILGLFEVLRAEYLELGARDEVRHVHVFENKGQVVGVSNPHP